MLLAADWHPCVVAETPAVRQQSVVTLSQPEKPSLKRLSCGVSRDYSSPWGGDRGTGQDHPPKSQLGTGPAKWLASVVNQGMPNIQVVPGTVTHLNLVQWE